MKQASFWGHFLTEVLQPQNNGSHRLKKLNGKIVKEWAI